MRKWILFLLSFIAIPYLVVFVASIFCGRVSIGGGIAGAKSLNSGKQILIEIDGLYKSMDVEEYIVGVLPGVVSADYDDTTLEVMAILIRTNIYKEMQEKKTEDASDISYHYMSVEERKDLFGERNYERKQRKIERAVENTAKKVIKKEDSLIMALYHEVSIGKTASAKEILGEDISYLQSVDSGRDVEAKNYMAIVKYSWEELSELMDDDNQTTIVVDESTENGFVKQASVNGVSYSGEEMMERFRLPSTNFYVEDVGDGIRFVCLGRGDCLGVSVYGANRMALDGRNSDEIIHYYYQDVSVTQ